MRKYFVAAMMASWVAIGFAAGNTPEEQLQQYSAQGRAYMTYDFGGVRRSNDAAMPLHYGFRVDSESRLAEERFTGLTDRRVPAVMQFDFSADGSRLATLNGIPFAGRSLIQRQNDGSGSPGSTPDSGGQAGGFTWFDWTLLAVGVGGLGYIISEVSKGKDDPDPPAGSTSGTGGTAGGGTTTPCNGTVVLGICVPTGGTR